MFLPVLWLASWLEFVKRSSGMAWNALRKQKDSSCSDARLMTRLEQESMERATAELDAEIDAVLEKRPSRFRAAQPSS